MQLTKNLDDARVALAQHCFRADFSDLIFLTKKRVVLYNWSFEGLLNCTHKEKNNNHAWIRQAFFAVRSECSSCLLVGFLENLAKITFA